MKIKRFYFIVLLVFFMGCEKDHYEGLDNLKIHYIKSVHTFCEYKLYVIYPHNFDDTEFYHTVYMLDGDWYIDEMSKFVDANFHNIAFVGIGYKNKNERAKDFTFPEDSRVEYSSGGADKHAQFLINELIPYIENEQGIKSSERTLAGHSFGGYFATYILFQQDYANPFDNIIMASPSLWWKDGYIFQLEDEFSSTNTDLDCKLFATIGSLEGGAMNSSFNALMKKIESRNYPLLTLRHKRYTKRSHNNTPLVSFKDGLNFIIKGE